MNKLDKHFYDFGPYRVDADKRLLLREGEAVSLTPKAFDTLMVLVEGHGQVLEKDALMQRLWPDSVVEEANLAQQISILRKVLADNLNERRYIVTVPGRGYRFAGSVTEVGREDVTLIVSVRSSASLTIEEEIETDGQDVTQAESQAVRKMTERARRKLSLPVLAVGLVAVGLAVTGFYFWRAGSSKQAEAGEALKSIAVLPFKPIGAAQRDEILELGMADTLITKLSNLRQIIVRPTSAVRRYTGLEQDPVTAGRELKVDSVLEGSVQQSGERIRVTVRLVRVSDGASLWAGQFDEKSTDIFAVQSSISEQATSALAVQLNGEEKARLAKLYTDNFKAYQLYLRGNYHLYKFTPGDMRKALDYFNEAIAGDPNYALAYTGLAYAYGLAAPLGVGEPNTNTARAEAAVNRAIALDPTLAEAHAKIGEQRFWLKRDTRGAQAAFSRALELNPNSAIVLHYYAWFLIAMTRHDEAERYLRRALELDPLSAAINVDQGLPLFFARRYDEARARYELALKSDDNDFYAHERLGEACEGAGDFARAMSEFERAAALLNNDPGVRALLARALALAGRQAEARRLLNELLPQSHPPLGSPYFVALAYLALGERDKAYAWLDRAQVDRDHWLCWIKADPRLDPLRRDERFVVLLGQAGF